MKLVRKIYYEIYFAICNLARPIKESKIVVPAVLFSNRIKIMIKETELNKTLSRYVTKDYFTKTLKKELGDQKHQILKETRVMIYESLETIKIYFEEQGNRHREALLQGFKDEMLVYKDQMKSYWERLDNHEHRIISLEKTTV